MPRLTALFAANAALLAGLSVFVGGWAVANVSARDGDAFTETGRAAADPLRSFLFGASAVAHVALYACVGAALRSQWCPARDALGGTLGVRPAEAPRPGPLWASVASLAVGCALYVASTGTVGPAVAEGTLVTSGVYMFLRNPQVLSTMLVHAGAALRVQARRPAWVVWGCWGVMWLYFDFCVRSDEEGLRERHGAEYEQYERLSWRFFPGY